MASKRYLTKGRFILGLECPTKLFYTKKTDEYGAHDSDPFLFELAKGGIQIGELAKFYFVDDPIAENITINGDVTDYEALLAETQRRLELPGKVIIAEAAFEFKNCFVRADIVVKGENGDVELYEVKSKSYREGDDKFLTKKNSIDSEWYEYLYDVAFQKWVIQNALNKTIKAHLVVVNKDANASVGGLSNFFKVIKNTSSRIEVQIPPGTSRSHLGNDLLRIFNVDNECNIIFNSELKLPLKESYSFATGVQFLANAYSKDTRIISTATPRCRMCEFYTSKAESEKGLKSGKHECWVGNGWVTQADFERQDLVVELWNGAGGNPSPVSKILTLGKHVLSQVVRGDFDSKNTESTDGLSKNDRRQIQIVKSQNRDFTPYVDIEGLRRTFNTFKYPLNFIDFETSSTALPWFEGLRPYQGIAFQFSHHLVHEGGKTEHVNQFLEFEAGKWPHLNFIRAFKEALKSNNGSIFRYSSHENTYLKFISRDLDFINPPDKAELQAFISSITKWNEPISGKSEGDREMIDLFEIVLKYFYSLHAKGSNSLKDILPAAIQSFPLLKEKYSKPIYGKGLEVESLNFANKIWIDERFNFDPYQTLDPVFEEYSMEELDRLVQDVDTVGDGGSAMMAYNMLQYSGIPTSQKERIKEALFKYCELDTLAMVMLYEGLKSTIND